MNCICEKMTNNPSLNEISTFLQYTSINLNSPIEESSSFTVNFINEKNDAMKSISLEELTEEKSNSINFKINLNNGQFSHQIVLGSSIIDNLI